MSNDPKDTTAHKGPEMQLQIQMDDDIAQGVYSNLVMVNHSQTEFVLDYMFVQSQPPKGKVRSRILLHPQTVKRLLLALNNNVRNYEKRFGTIELNPVSKPPASDVH